MSSLLCMNKHEETQESPLTPHIKLVPFSEVQKHVDGKAMKDSSLNPSQPAHLEDCDPEALARHCLLPEDDAIRRKDVPERFQYQFETHEAVRLSLRGFEEKSVFRNLISTLRRNGFTKRCFVKNPKRWKANSSRTVN